MKGANMPQNYAEKKKNSLVRMMVRLIMVSFASLVMAMNINTFVHTGELIPGGASGLTLLIQEIGIKYFNISLPYTVINIIINAIPVYIGFRFIGKKFTALSCWVIGLVFGWLPLCGFAVLSLAGFDLIRPSATAESNRAVNNCRAALR